MKIATPKRGEIVMVELNPTLGHEQKGRRPALVVSHDSFNAKTGLILICPITSKMRNNPFEVAVIGAETRGVILPQQLRTIDFLARSAVVCDRTDDFSLQEVISKIKLIID